VKLLFKRRLERIISDNPKGEDLEKEREELKKLADVRDVQLERAVELLQGLLAYMRAASLGKETRGGGMAAAPPFSALSPRR